MKISWQTATTLLLIVLLGAGYSFIRGHPSRTEAVAQTDTASIAPFDLLISQNALRMLQEGRATFRFDTFGDEAFWGDQLHLHQAIAGASPKMALALGLKVDVDALPATLLDQLQQGQVNLDDPAVTLALLQLN